MNGLFYRYALLLLFTLIATTCMFGQVNHPLILDERERAEMVDKILEDRFENLLPKLMKRSGIKMWIVISREYNEDPIMKTMLPATWLSARRRTILLFFDQGEGKELEKIAIARYDVGSSMQGAWDIDVYPDQWDALMKIIADRNPENIGLNLSGDFGLADGLVYTEYTQFMEHLPAAFKDRVVSAENLAIAWLETRSALELEIYPMICHLAHNILQEGLSEKAIHPGITTTDDVVWYLRDRVTSLGLDTWFQPSVSIQRADPENFDHLRSFSKASTPKVIQRGDLLHVDFGISYLRLNTDQQQHFYVLKEGETEVPKSLVNAFSNSNRLQDILADQFKLGTTGNIMLENALAQAKSEGIKGSIYTHPIGVHGHAAGPTIGMWDQQQGVPGRGDYPLYENTAYSIELNTASEIPEWNKIIRIMLEEDAYFDGEKLHYFDGRQKEILTIPRNPMH